LAKVEKIVIKLLNWGSGYLLRCSNIGSFYGDLKELNKVKLLVKLLFKYKVFKDLITNKLLKLNPPQEYTR